MCLQPLHGVTFGLFWVAARDRWCAIAAQRAPTAAQGLFSAAALGIGSLIGMNVAGALLERGGGRLLYTVAGACAALGTSCAVAYAARQRT